MISHLISITIFINLPSYPCNQRLIIRVRQDVQPEIENDKTLKITLPKELERTHSGEAFLHFDTGEDDPERILIFATTDNLDTLYNADSWYCDGTISLCPQKFFQLYTVQALVEGSMIPLAFALLPNKKEETYIKMVQEFKYYPKHVSLDFEIAASKAFKKWTKTSWLNTASFIPVNLFTARYSSLVLLKNIVRACNSNKESKCSLAWHFCQKKMLFSDLRAYRWFMRIMKPFNHCWITSKIVILGEKSGEKGGNP